MPRRLPLPAILLFLAIFLSGIVTVPLFAGGQQEDLMGTARQNVIEKRYDLALAELAQLIKDNPKRLDEAQGLISQIIQLKGGYNQYFQDLIDTLTNDPGNYSKSLELINKMSAVDPNPSSRTKQQIEDFRILAKIKKDRNDRDAIMAKALKEIQNKQYSAAIDTYLSGFSLQSADFLIGTQAEDFRKAVLDFVSTIKNDVVEYTTENSNLMPSLALFTKEIQGSDGLDQVIAALPAFSSKFLRTISQTVRIEQAVAESAKLRARSDAEYPPSDKNYNYNEYLRFVQEFVSGPPGKTGQGIAYAARRLVDDEYADTLKRLDDLYNLRKQEVAQLLKNGSKTAANGNTSDITISFAGLYLAGNILLRAYGLRGNIDLGSNPDFSDLNARLPVAFRKVPISILMELKAYSLLETVLKRKDSLAKLSSSNDPAVWRVTLTEYDSLLAAVEKWNKEIQTVQDAGFVDEAAVSTARKVFSAPLNQVQSSLLALGRERFTTIVQGLFDAVRTPFVASAKEENQGLALLQGINQGNSTALYRYPDKALQIFTNLKQQYEDFLKSLDGLDSLIGQARPELRDWPAIQTTSAGSRTVRANIQNALARLDVQIASAQSNIKKAQDSLAAATEAYSAAEAAISGTKLDVDTAEKAFSTSTNQYFAAFDLAYNKDQRDVADSRLKDLRGRIDVARNTLLVQQTRELINGAMALFEQDEYQRALDNITQAENLDSQTVAYREQINQGKRPVDAHNPQIPYWKSRIQAAASLSNERTIAEADPAFFSLSNYLNLAQVDYNAAVRKIAAGDKDSAAKLIDRAKNNLSNILLVKPNNSAAKLLQLKLELISDPDAFAQRFPKRVADLVAQSKKEPSTASLSDLTALRDMNPKYPGLQDAIDNLEVDLGLRDSPLTIQNQQESRSLVAQGRVLAQSSSQTDLQRANQLAKRALQLNPRSQEAANLIDAIGIRLRTAQDTLSFEEQQTLQNAQNLFVTGNAGGAYKLALELRKQHPNYQPLNKLIEQIERQLGINR